METKEIIVLNLGLDNLDIYEGVSIESVGGRKTINLTQDNLNLIKRNIKKYIRKVTQCAFSNSAIVLTGAIAIPVYLTALCIALEYFAEIKYKNEMLELVIDSTEGE